MQAWTTKQNGNSSTVTPEVSLQPIPGQIHLLKTYTVKGELMHKWKLLPSCGPSYWAAQGQRRRQCTPSAVSLPSCTVPLHPHAMPGCISELYSGRGRWRAETLASLQGMAPNGYPPLPPQEPHTWGLFSPRRTCRSTKASPPEQIVAKNNLDQDCGGKRLSLKTLYPHILVLSYQPWMYRKKHKTHEDQICV